LDLGSYASVLGESVFLPFISVYHPAFHVDERVSPESAVADR
jgi:hypothetical protein